MSLEAPTILSTMTPVSKVLNAKISLDGTLVH